jgi:hypothetical protein
LLAKAGFKVSSFEVFAVKSDLAGEGARATTTNGQRRATNETANEQHPADS